METRTDHAMEAGFIKGFMGIVMATWMFLG